MRAWPTSLLGLLLIACAAGQPDATARPESQRVRPESQWKEIDANGDDGRTDEADKLDVSDVNDPARANCLRLIHACSRPGGCANPAPNIRAVNALIPFGTEEALKILRDYDMRTGRGRRSRGLPGCVFTVARLAFVPAQKGGSLRGPMIGDFGLEVQPESVHWSLYPFVLHDGIPFDLSLALMGGGQAESPTEYLDYLQSTAILRTELLIPADNPLEAADRLIRSGAWKDIRFSSDEPGNTYFVNPEGLMVRLRNQAAGAISGIYRPSRDLWEGYSFTKEYDWDGHLAAVRLLKPRWDWATQRYVRGD